MLLKLKLIKPVLIVDVSIVNSVVVLIKSHQNHPMEFVNVLLLFSDVVQMELISKNPLMINVVIFLNLVVVVMDLQPEKMVKDPTVQLLKMILHVVLMPVTSVVVLMVLLLNLMPPDQTVDVKEVNMVAVVMK